MYKISAFSIRVFSGMNMLPKVIYARFTIFLFIHYMLSCFEEACIYILHFDALVQDCSNSIANALELLQSCTKPSL